MASTQQLKPSIADASLMAGNKLAVLPELGEPGFSRSLFARARSMRKRPLDQAPNTFPQAKGTPILERKTAVPPAPWLAQALSSRWQLYRARLGQCRKRPSADSVHELRVSIRRLTAQVALFESIRSNRRAQRVQRLLKRQFEALGSLRDCHVQRIFIEHHADKFPELLILLHYLERRERKLIRTVSREVNQFRSRKLGKWIQGMASDLIENCHDNLKQHRLLALAFRRAEDAYAETVARWRSIDIADTKTIHHTRVAFKKFRYLVECLPAEATGFTKRDLRQLAYYQRRMGNIQDFEVIQDCIQEFIPRYAGAEALLAPFCANLRARRNRALRSFMRSADKLSQFWPPPALAKRAESARNQCAA